MSKPNQELQSALNDIAVIKQTLEKTKVHFGKLSILFIIFGVTQILVYILQQVGRFICINNEFFKGITIIFFIKYITLAILFVFFFKMRKNIKESNNIYTLQLFDIWGIILFAVPLIRFVVIFMQFILYNDKQMPNIALFAYTCVGLIEYTSVIMGVLMTGCILNKKVLKITAYILLCILPLLFFITGENIIIDSIMTAYGKIYDINAIGYIITLVLYIVMGVVFKFYNGGDKFGA